MIHSSHAYRNDGMDTSSQKIDKILLNGISPYLGSVSWWLMESDFIERM
jgi:hypothetical protein